MADTKSGYHHGDLRAALIDAGLELTRAGGPDALSTEQFALHQIGRQSGTVDGDERSILARAHVVDGGGDQLFPGTGLTEDEEHLVFEGATCSAR